MNNKTFMGVVLLLLMTSCSHQDLVDKIVSENDIAAAEKIYLALQKKDHTYIRLNASEQILSEDFESKIAAIALQVPEQDYINKTIVGAQRHEFNNMANVVLSIQYTYADQYVLANFNFHQKDSNYLILGINIQPSAVSLAEHHAFTFKGKGLVHFVILLYFIAVLVFTVWTFNECRKFKPLKHRKKWLFFILLGLGNLQINWTTGQIFLQVIYIQLFSLSFTTGPYSPWVFGVSLPIGAIMFWMFKEQLTVIKEKIPGQDKPEE